jgi:hypothetical protein
MKLSERYRRLNLWNKIAFWGSVCSIVGLVLYLLALIFVKSSTALSVETPTAPAIAVKYKGNEIFLVNEGGNTLEDLRFYPVLYTFHGNLKVRERDVTRGPTFTFPTLLAGATILVPKTNYLDESRFRSLSFSNGVDPNPIMLAVILFHRSGDNKVFHKMEPFLVASFSPITLLQMRQLGQMMPRGYLGFYPPMIKEMEDYEESLFIEE